MSIQGTINTVISMGGVLATQTPQYERNKAIARENRIEKNLDKATESLAKREDYNTPEYREVLADIASDRASAYRNLISLGVKGSASKYLNWKEASEYHQFGADQLREDIAEGIDPNDGPFGDAQNLPSNERNENVGNYTPNSTNAPTSQNIALDNARKAQEYTEGKKMQKRLARNPKLLEDANKYLEVKYNG